MAILIQTQGGKRYVTLDNTPPSKEEMKLAEDYDKQLRIKIANVQIELKTSNFF